MREVINIYNPNGDIPGVWESLANAALEGNDEVNPNKMIALC